MLSTTSGQFNLDNATLYYEIAGTGEPLVLSHAAFLDSRMFDALWEPLAQHFQVIRYDMRGFGRSTEVHGPVCRRQDLERLLQHLEISSAHLVGCSAGGELMLDMALEQPELVSSLTIVGSTPGGFEMQGEPPRYIDDMFSAFQQGDVDRANELQIRIWIDGMFREPALRNQALRMNRIPVERSTFLIGDMEPVCPLDPPAVQRLSEVKCPVLVVAGTLDHPEIVRAAGLMVDRIPGARKILMNNTGHVPSYEQPEAFLLVLLDFLQK